VAIRKVCHVPGESLSSAPPHPSSASTESVAVHEMPAQGVSWTHVASELNNQRLPLDYQRRWATLRLQVSALILGCSL
jgi:hypothetical protein